MKIKVSELRQLIREEFKNVNELNFLNKKTFDIYTKNHKLRPDTQVTIDGKSMTAGQATKMKTTSSKPAAGSNSLPNNKTLGGINFTKKESQFLAALINSLGSGGHPMPDSSTISGFTIPYVTSLMKKAKTKVPAKFKSEYDSVSLKLK